MGEVHIFECARSSRALSRGSGANSHGRLACFLGDKNLAAGRGAGESARLGGRFCVGVVSISELEAALVWDWCIFLSEGGVRGRCRVGMVQIPMVAWLVFWGIRTWLPADVLVKVRGLAGDFVWEWCAFQSWRPLSCGSGAHF